MTKSVYVSSDDGSNPVLGVLILPPLVPPGYLAWQTLTQLSAHGVHPMFQIFTVVGELAAFIYGLYLFYPPGAELELRDDQAENRVTDYYKAHLKSVSDRPPL